MIIDSEKCTVRQATELAVRKWLGEKSVRLIVSGIALVISGALTRFFYQYHAMLTDGAGFVIQTILAALMILSAATLLSNIGKFSGRRFIGFTVVSFAVLLAAASVYEALGAMDFTMAIPIGAAIIGKLWEILPSFAISAAVIVLAALLISAIKRRRAEA